MNIKTIGTAKRDKMIKELGVGEFGYTVPWAARFNEDGKVFALDEERSLTNSVRDDTRTMKVTRTRDGYECDLTLCEWYRISN